jgi:hypothetical protein
VLLAAWVEYSEREVRERLAAITATHASITDPAVVRLLERVEKVNELKTTTLAAIAKDARDTTAKISDAMEAVVDSDEEDDASHDAVLELQAAHQNFNAAELEKLLLVIQKAAFDSKNGLYRVTTEKTTNHKDGTKSTKAVHPSIFDADQLKPVTAALGGWLHSDFFGVLGVIPDYPLHTFALRPYIGKFLDAMVLQLPFQLAKLALLHPDEPLLQKPGGVASIFSCMVEKIDGALWVTEDSKRPGQKKFRQANAAQASKAMLRQGPLAPSACLPQLYAAPLRIMCASCVGLGFRFGFDCQV